jgi:hypothetical protein
MPDYDGGENGFAVLRFAKRGAGWALYVVTTDDFDNEHETALLNASKRLRFRAAKVVDDLVDALIREARKQLDDVEAANRNLDATLSGKLGDVELPDEYSADEDVPF